MRAHIAARSRRGTILILVLGLIALFMALMISITIRVYNAGKENETMRRNAQAYAMLAAAKLYIADYAHTKPPLDALSFAATIYPTSFPNSTLADRLGWAHIRRTGQALDAGVYTYTSFDIIAAGGASAAGGKSSLNYGSDIANAFDVRYLFQVRFSNRVYTFDQFTLQPVEDYSTYW